MLLFGTLLRNEIHSSYILTQSVTDGAVKQSKTSKLRRLPKGNRIVAEDNEVASLASAEVVQFS